MCIFSGPIRDVSDTNIFARLTGRKTQFLVYRMAYSTDRDLAMILPLPVAPHTGEKSVRFINLKNYSDFFEDMDNGFPLVQTRSKGAAMGGAVAADAAPRLIVHFVGDFVASFVPTLHDFNRLDKRFALPPQTWDKIPAYHNYGFAVFKLKSSRDPKTVHPMAFEFPTRFSDRIFLPTVHIHDGQVHKREAFDHTLYVQDLRLHATDTRNSFGGISSASPNDVLERSPRVAARFLDMSKTHHIIHGALPVFKRTLRGMHANTDTFIHVPHRV